MTWHPENILYWLIAYIFDMKLPLLELLKIDGFEKKQEKNSINCQLSFTAILLLIVHYFAKKRNCD